MSNEASATRHRGNRRSTSMRTAGLTGLGLRFLSMIILLVTTPLLVHSLGDAVFGIFVTITALTAYLALSDLGIGAGLLTLLGAAAGQEDHKQMAGLVVNAAWILLAAGTAVGILGLVLAKVIDIPRLLGAAPEDARSAAVAFRVFVVGFAASIPLTLGARVHASLQQGAEAAVWLSATTSLTAAAAATTAWVTGSLVATVFASVAATFVVSLLQTFRVYRQHPWIRINGARFRRADSRGLVSSSGLLLVLQVSAVVAFQTDIIVVAAVLGSDSAAVFHGTLRAFALVSLATTALVAQFWPATAEAISMKDHRWVRDTHRRLAWQLPLIAALAGTVLVVFGQQLIGLWLGKSLVPPLSLLIAFALWTTYSSFILPYSSLMNGAGILRPQAIIGVLMALANLALTLWLTKTIGLAGPPLGSLLAHVSIALVPAIILVRRVLREEGNLAG